MSWQVLAFLTTLLLDSELHAISIWCIASDQSSIAAAACLQEADESDEEEGSCSDSSKDPICGGQMAGRCVP